MMNTRLAVGGGRIFIKNVIQPALALLLALVENTVLAPEPEMGFLHVDDIKLGRDRSEHDASIFGPGGLSHRISTHTSYTLYPLSPIPCIIFLCRSTCFLPKSPRRSPPVRWSSALPR